MRENHPQNSSTAQNLLVRNIILVLCFALPWLNPFASSPSTAVIPLLVSWMMAACALLAVVELPLVKTRWTLTERVVCGALVLWLLASLLWVPQVVDRALTAGLVASLMCVWLMAAVGRRAAVDEVLLRWLVVGLLAAAVISAVLGMLQYLGLARELSPWVNQPLKGDAFANLRQRNQFASLTSLGLVALLGGVAAQSKAQTMMQTMTRGSWALAFVLLNVLAAGVACSVSRTGAMQWVLVSVLMAAWGWRSAKRDAGFGKGLVWFSIAAPVLVAVWSVLMPWLALQTTGEWGASMILRVTGQAQDYAACGGRRVLWANVLALIAQHPWLGWGWGETDYAHFMTGYSNLRFCDMLDNAHDFPLHLALEFGVPFALAVMALVAVWVLRRSPWCEQQAWRVMAWCLLVVLGLHSVLEYPLWYGPFQMTLGLAIGLLWAPTHVGLEADGQAEAKVEPQVEAQEGPMLIAAILFIGCLYAAWDFSRVGQIYRQAASRDAAYRDNPLHHAKQSWLFKNQADFAELTTQAVTADNAAELYPQAIRLMHYSPEARVVQRVIDSGKLLGHDEEAQAFTERLDDVKQNAPR